MSSESSLFLPFCGDDMRDDEDEDDNRSKGQRTIKQVVNESLDGKVVGGAQQDKNGEDGRDS